jgi:uncharacterized iron-regulated protein
MTKIINMIKIKTIISLAVALAPAGAGAGSADDLVLYDLAAKEAVALQTVVPELARKRVVLVGELHSEKAHHDAQLQVVRLMAAAGIPVAMGFEMFQAESQEALDRWVGGEMTREDFQRVYYENWNFPWYLYRDLFEYAREQKIPMVGLNVPRDITRQVARQGFASLTDEQRGRLPEVACRVDKKYMAFIRRAFGAHAHGNLNFTYFCEAQLVWDTAMAVHAIRYLEAHPDTTMVVITGSGHARKMGIPDQIRLRADLPMAVLLPEVPGAIDSQTVGTDDADYLFLMP